MKVREFIEKTKGKEDCDITVEKHDKGQLTSHTTVPVEDIHLGFDWTHNQIIIQPTVKLMTHSDVVKEAYDKKFKELLESRTEHLRLVASLARMIQEIDNVELRERIHRVLKEF